MFTIVVIRKEESPLQTLGSGAGFAISVVSPRWTRRGGVHHRLSLMCGGFTDVERPVILGIFSFVGTVEPKTCLFLPHFSHLLDEMDPILNHPTRKLLKRREIYLF
jgi:hypothetical protein